MRYEDKYQDDSWFHGTNGHNSPQERNVTAGRTLSKVLLRHGTGSLSRSICKGRAARIAATGNARVSVFGAMIGIAAVRNWIFACCASAARSDRSFGRVPAAKLFSSATVYASARLLVWVYANWS